MIVCLVIYWKQESIVQELVDAANHDFKGRIAIEGSHVSPFANFPFVSIDLDQVKVFEDKTTLNSPILNLSDVYLGFDILSLLRGEVVIKALKLEDGFIRLIQHTDGSFNIANALSGKDEIEDVNEEFHLDIQLIQLVNVDILKFNEANDIWIETFIDEAKSRFKTTPDHVLVSLDSRLKVNVLQNGDTTFVKNKHLQMRTQLDYQMTNQLLEINPSELKIENAVFSVFGTIDFDDNMNLDITLDGSKPNFDLFLAFAPVDLAPVLARYDNAGKIFFNASIKGKSINGHNPIIVADFGCEDAFFNNRTSNKKLDQLFFKGHFTTGEHGNAATSEFTLTDFSARPEAGTFSGNLVVRNFESPEIDMKLRSQFELEFLAKFLEINNLNDLKGSVALTMNFHDIIDLSNPEKSIEKLNESYFTELDIKNLSFKSTDFHLPVHDIDLRAVIDGHKASIEYMFAKVGSSDVSVKATITDLPAILHHTATPTEVNLSIESGIFDIKELTSGDTLKSKPIDEKITNLSLQFKFISSAKSFTESPNLPVGEFFIDNLFAKLNHYPHTLHDFHADVFIDREDFRVVDFTGMIDSSDFHFSGRLKNYDLWFMNEPEGDTKMEVSLSSKLLQLEDLFSYGGANYVPEEYRHEVFRNLNLHGFADLHFNKGLKSVDLSIDKLETNMKVHPLRFKNFNGSIHYEDEHLRIDNLAGKLGSSDMVANLNYYLGSDSVISKRDNHFSLKASRLNFDELFSYNPSPKTAGATASMHEEGFNIYDLPFSNMSFDFDIKHLNYHRYELNNFYVKARTTKNHFIYLDTMSLQAAGGMVRLKGYFNGSDRNRIYFSPQMTIENVNLDKLLFKFENFGQDHLVSENLHGNLSGNISGKVHVHPDLVPIIDDSELHLNIDVIQGQLENYSALEAMSDFFKDKNLDKVRFDTLSNTLDFSKGVLSIPSMTINSTLGFIELSGKQDVDMNMEYYIRIPWKLVAQIGKQKLFGTKDVDPDKEDAIQFRDPSKRQRFINLKLSGTPDNYKITLARDRSE